MRFIHAKLTWNCFQTPQYPKSTKTLSICQNLMNEMWNISSIRRLLSGYDPATQPVSILYGHLGPPSYPSQAHIHNTDTMTLSPTNVADFSFGVSRSLTKSGLSFTVKGNFIWWLKKKLLGSMVKVMMCSRLQCSIIIFSGIAARNWVMISLFPFTPLLFLLDRNNIKRAFTVGKHHCFYITAKFWGPVWEVWHDIVCCEVCVQPVSLWFVNSIAHSSTTLYAKFYPVKQM